MFDEVVFAIHGFLGQASDWDVIAAKVPQFKFERPELFSKKISAKLSAPPGKRKIFMGYSLGGRLGLKLLKEKPSQFDHYIFLSTHPGLPESDTEGRRQRILSDQRWAEKISAENWNVFLKEWNSQIVFQNSLKEPDRKSEDFDIEKLKNSLQDWSLGKQEDFSDVIRAHQAKISWVVGDQDLKFCKCAENLKIKYQKVSSGHRIWLDNPDAIVKVLNQIND